MELNGPSTNYSFSEVDRCPWPIFKKLVFFNSQKVHPWLQKEIKIDRCPQVIVENSTFRWDFFLHGRLSVSICSELDVWCCSNVQNPQDLTTLFLKEKYSLLKFSKKISQRMRGWGLTLKNLLSSASEFLNFMNAPKIFLIYFSWTGCQSHNAVQSKD